MGVVAHEGFETPEHGLSPLQARGEAPWTLGRHRPVEGALPEVLPAVGRERARPAAQVEGAVPVVVAAGLLGGLEPALVAPGAPGDLGAPVLDVPAPGTGCQFGDHEGAVAAEGWIAEVQAGLHALGDGQVARVQEFHVDGPVDRGIPGARGRQEGGGEGVRGRTHPRPGPGRRGHPSGDAGHVPGGIGARVEVGEHHAARPGRGSDRGHVPGGEVPGHVLPVLQGALAYEEVAAAGERGEERGWGGVAGET